MKIREEKNMSIAYAFFLLLAGLAITGLMYVAMEQFLGVNFHYLAVDLGLTTGGTSTLALLENMLAWIPVALTVSVLVGFVVNAYRERYNI